MTEIIALVGGLVALLLGALGVTVRQRNFARKEADAAKKEAATERAARRQQQQIEKARAESRKKSAEIQHEADQRPNTKRPSGSFRT